MASLAPGASVHFMGIGGYGMSAIARVMADMGYHVSGCDVNESALIPPLREKGIAISLGHDPDHLSDSPPDALAISSAIPDSHPEVQAARAAGIPVYKRADILGPLMAGKTGLAIAGTHGKTTTTAMLAYVLEQARLGPSYIIGGVSKNLGTNAAAGKGMPFVVEADEYDGMFLGLRPKIAVVTSIEMDHPDMFPDMNAVREMFTRFVDLLPPDGLLICGHDSHETLQLARRRMALGFPALTCGTSGGTWQAERIQPNDEGGVSFSVRYMGVEAYEASLKMPGEHNVRNALTVLAAATELGVPVVEAIEILRSFEGVGRRFEVRGTPMGVTIIDDYAHHPTAIRATLAAARQRFGNGRVWAVWQPHTFSRTRMLLNEFAESFGDADHVIITDIFRSRDKETFGLGVVDIIARMASHGDVQHIARFDMVVDYLTRRTRPGDAVIVMSAGDATRISDDLLQALSAQERKR